MIPASITTALASLEAQVQAATPLANAPFSTIKAIQLNAGNLVASIQSTLVAAPNLLDTWTGPIDPPSIVAGFDTVVTASEDQNNLSLMRGIVGRANLNLDQLV